MRDDIIDLIMNPYSGNDLKQENDSLVDVITNECFSIKNGIPVILREEEVIGLNRIYQKRYDWFVYF